MCDTQGLVKVTREPELKVGFVDGVKEIGHNDGNIDPLAVGDKRTRTWPRFWITGAYPDGVEGRLHPSCHQLWYLISLSFSTHFWTDSDGKDNIMKDDGTQDVWECGLRVWIRSGKEHVYRRLTKLIVLVAHIWSWKV